MPRPRPAQVALLLLLLGWTLPAAASAHHGSLFGGGVSQAELAGLRPADPLGICRGEGYEIVVEGEADGCTHGPDPASAFGFAGAASIAGASATGEAAARCIGDGSSGPRVQMIYARIAGTAGEYAQTAPVIQDWAVTMNTMMRGGAAETGGARDLRFVTDASCRAVVADVAISASAGSNISTMITELHGQGFTRPDRKYVVWVESTTYCGIAEGAVDDRPGAGNNNNGTLPRGLFARIDRRCWSPTVGLHELLHTLGAVQGSAPHATAAGHCWDEWDVMCYVDGVGVTMSHLCPDRQSNQVVDCNHDDYYNTAPAPGTYLATHWNVARSVFLEPDLPPPPSLPPAPPAPPASPPPASPPPAPRRPRLRRPRLRRRRPLRLLRPSRRRPRRPRPPGRRRPARSWPAAGAGRRSGFRTA